jgi:hypothetical protein
MDIVKTPLKREETFKPHQPETNSPAVSTGYDFTYIYKLFLTRQRAFYFPSQIGETVP